MNNTGKTNLLFLILNEKNLLQSYLSAKYQVEDKGKLYLIYMEEQQQEASLLLKALEENLGLDVKSIVLKEESSNSFYDIFRERVKEISGTGVRVVLDYTGGSNFLAVHLCTAFDKLSKNLSFELAFSQFVFKDTRVSTRIGICFDNISGNNPSFAPISLSQEKAISEKVLIRLGYCTIAALLNLGEDDITYPEFVYELIDIIEGEMEIPFFPSTTDQDINLTEWNLMLTGVEIV